MGLSIGDQGVDDRAEHGPEDGQGEAGAGLAEGGSGEAAARHQRDMVQGGVAVEDLDEEPMDDGGRRQKGRSAPGVSGGAAGGVDDVAAELGGEVLSRSALRASRIRRCMAVPPVLCEREKDTMVHGGAGYLKAKGRLGLHGLNAIQ